VFWSSTTLKLSTRKNCRQQTASPAEALRYSFAVQSLELSVTACPRQSTSSFARQQWREVVSFILKDVLFLLLLLWEGEGRGGEGMGGIGRWGWL